MNNTRELAIQIANTSHYLADVSDIICYRKWNKIHSRMMKEIYMITPLVDDVDELLMEVGADPDVIYNS